MTFLNVIYKLSIFYAVVYVVAMCYYAIDFMIIKMKEKKWADAKEIDVITKLMLLSDKYMPEDSGDTFLKDIIKLKKYNLDFRIDCYREGIKKRMENFISE